MLLADGNGPVVDIVETPTETPVATPTTEATQSSTLAYPTPTPEPKGWFTGTTVFWGIVVILAITAFIYWLKNRK